MRSMKYRIMILIAFISLRVSDLLAQRPQNVDIGKGRGESAWDSTTTILLIIAFFLLMFISRRWSKKIQDKRDQLSKKNYEDEAPSESEQDPRQ